MDVAGVGKITSGDYENINISGLGTIPGNISANKVEISGKGKSLGYIDCKCLYVSGTFKGKENVKSSEEINISGLAKFTSIYCNYINVNGKIALDKGLNFNKINMEGWLTVLKNCQGQEFIVDGKVNIKGLLSADIIDISLRGKSYIKEIGGEGILIKNGGGVTIKIFNLAKTISPYMECELIEGDRVDIENTRCKIIRGENITIREGCIIDKIECSGKLNINEKSKVLDIIYINENKLNYNSV
ncbi:MAG: hypothetical protein Q4B63_08160 [Clostridium perfringens]|nr:hypothetical protein [Clostridium perfringens]